VDASPEVVAYRTRVRYGAPPLDPTAEVPLLDAPVQTTLHLGIPLAEVTFCVVDLETTGGSATDAAITEIGAVAYRGGERLGTFSTLVDPGRPIPPYVAHLTGIDDRLVAGAPPIEHVLPSFTEFARGAVIVAHNASFDVSFLNTALDRLDYPPLPAPAVCTAKLARRVVWPDVPNVRLRTLAEYFRTRVTPIHRALADAEATGEVLLGLLTFGERLGITTLGDLHEACTARGRPNYGKIRLADDLPRSPGVYVFKDAHGKVLYVGKSNDVRSRVRSYFYGDERKKVQNLLEEVRTVDAVATPSGELEALVVEARLIRRSEPPYNRQGTTWRRSCYLKLDPSEAYPRLKIVRSASDDGATYLGPFSTNAVARLAKEAIEEVVPIRRCTVAMRPSTRFAPCALADIGRCAAPCDGRTDTERYGELVGGLLSSLCAPGGLLAALGDRMGRLADQERFEEAADVRDRASALAEALWRARVDAWLTAGRLRLVSPTPAPIELERGSLRRGDGEPPIGSPCPRERAAELAAVRSWICRHPPVVEDCDLAPAEPVEGGAALARARRSFRDATSRDRRSVDRR
jgi:DNA polymerase-3 subunit epsilon